MAFDNVRHTNAKTMVIPIDQRIKRLEETIKSMKDDPTFINSNYLQKLKRQLKELKHETKI